MFGLMLLSGCEITEKVYIDENANVSYSSFMDISNLMMLSSEQEFMDDLPIDTTFTYSTLVQSDYGVFPEDFHLDDEEEIDLMKDFKVNLKMEKQSGFMSIYLEKQSMAEFNNFMQNINNQVKKINQERSLRNMDSTQYSPPIELPILSNPLLTYDGKTFTRKGKIEKLSKHHNEDLEEIGNLIRFNLEYHFPKPIQWISDESIKMSADRKIIYVEKPLHEILENPNAYDFEVRF